MNMRIQRRVAEITIVNAHMALIFVGRAKHFLLQYVTINT